MLTERSSILRCRPGSWLRSWAVGTLVGLVGIDRVIDTADDGGMATWDTAQQQALVKFGIILDDFDGNNVPMIASDPYGNFIPGPNGLPLHQFGRLQTHQPLTNRRCGNAQVVAKLLDSAGPPSVQLP